MLRILSSICERFGLNAYVQGDFPKAEAWFRRLEKAEPDSIRVLRNLGVILLAKGDLAGARAYLIREESLYGPSFHRHAGLGDLAWIGGERVEAASRYAAALAEPEAQSGARHSASTALLAARFALCRDEASFQKTRQGLEKFHQGEAAREAGKFQEALDLFLAAADLDPSNWIALNNAGSIALNNLGDTTKALSCFSRAFALSPSSQVGRNLQIANEAIEKASRPVKKTSKGSRR